MNRSLKAVAADATPPFGRCLLKRRHYCPPPPNGSADVRVVTILRHIVRASIRSPSWAPKLLSAARMTIELVSNATGKALHLSAKAFSRLLHVAKQNGWDPERTPQDWPEASWDTEIFLPYVDCYIPGQISRSEARSLKGALIKASGTGQFAFDGSLRLASEVLLQVARQGAFLVRCKAAEPLLQTV